MSLPKLTENLNKVSSLAEKPTLTAQQLQAVFDEAGNAIKDYINDVLTTAIEQLITSTVQTNKTTVENVLTSTSITNALSARQGKVLGDRFNYSTTEKVIGTWIDGKPLYKKTINFGALPNSTTKGVAHNIQNLKRVVKLEGFAGSSLHNGGITLPHSTDTNPIALYIDNTDVRVLTLIDDSVYTESYVYIYYTKTTD